MWDAMPCCWGSWGSDCASSAISGETSATESTPEQIAAAKKFARNWADE